MVIPLQYAVLVGVGLSVILHVVRQSNQITIKRWQIDPDGNVIETDPPAGLPAGEVVVLQPYGSLFFAAAPAFEAGLPALTDASRHSVVILRLRGRTDLGTTFMDVLHRYAQGLAALGSKLVIVSASELIQEQLKVTTITDLIGPENVYTGDERVGATLKRAHTEAVAWIEANQPADETDAQGEDEPKKRVAVECACQPPRKLHMTPKQIEDGPVICGLCHARFELPEAAQEQ